MSDKASERSDMWASEMDTSDTSDDSDALDASDASDAEDAEDAQTPWDVESIRDAWHPNSIRLPEELQRQFNGQYGKVDSELQLAGVDRDFQKDRQYKPLVVALGLRELDAMDTEDVVDALEELEQGKLP